MPDEARDGRNVALKWQLEVKSHLLACLIIQNNHPIINSSMPNNVHASITSHFGPVPSIDLEEQKESWQGQKTILLVSSNAKIRESFPKVLDCTYHYRRPRLTPSKPGQNVLLYGLQSQTRWNRRRLLAQVDGLKHDLQRTTAAADHSCSWVSGTGEDKNRQQNKSAAVTEVRRTTEWEE